jgi:hypothetical protein
MVMRKEESQICFSDVIFKLLRGSRAFSPR